MRDRVMLPAATEREDDEWRVLDSALDAYREHRATSTPLDQELGSD